MSCWNIGTHKFLDNTSKSINTTAKLSTPNKTYSSDNVTFKYPESWTRNPNTDNH